MAVSLEDKKTSSDTDRIKGSVKQTVCERRVPLDGESDGDSTSFSEGIDIATPTITMTSSHVQNPEVQSRRRRVLLSTESAYAEHFLPVLMQNPDVELRLITDEEPSTISTGASKIPHYTDSVDGNMFEMKPGQRKWLRAKAAELSAWADLLIVAPIDAGTLASMLSGLTCTLTLSLLRCWDSNKAVMVVPGMTLAEWKNPLTNRQLHELEQYWPWVITIPPLLWKLDHQEEFTQIEWEGKHKYEEVVRQALGLASNTSASPVQEVTPSHPENVEHQQALHTKALPDKQVKTVEKKQQTRSPKSLPLEIWLTIFEDHLSDWEIAKAVGIPTRLPVPKEWQPHILKMSAPASLEYTILRGSFAAIKSRIEALPRWKPLSDLACHLILKFSRTDILTYLAENHLDLLLTTTRLNDLPYRASAIYGNPNILSWWRDSALPRKEYLADAIDGASRAGFVNVLEWWRTSGLPLRYTERALESASAEGKVAVLEWWKQASANSPPENPIPLKVGKSVLLAAQSGSVESIAWWDASGIPYSHSESVARIASTHGHVHVLSLWHRLKGPKMIFDHQVLVGATRNGHDHVLEWWRRSGLRVEFKTCDIEEALEDADPSSGAEQRVREWWARNGLNLGVGTSEWMKVKVLSPS